MIILDCLGWPRIVKSRGRQKRGSEKEIMETGLEGCNIVGFEVVKGATNQGMWVVFRKLKRQGNVFSLIAFSKKCSPG